MLELLTLYAQALEDFVIWARTIREAQGKMDSRLEDVLDHMAADWAGAVAELSVGSAEAYRDLWGLPEFVDPQEQKLYEEQLAGWAHVGRRIANTLTVRTPGGTVLMRRVLNKAKHGIYVSAVEVGADVYLLFHPEAGKAADNYPKQIVSEDAATRLAVQTYTVCKLLSATLRQVFAIWYGRVPDADWPDVVRAGSADEETLEGILVVTNAMNLPHLAW